MRRYNTYLWKQVPFVRLIIPFIAGILIQWYFTISINYYFAIAAFCLLIWLAFKFISTSLHFALQWFQGSAIQLLMLVAGALVTYQKDIRHSEDWIGNNYKDSSVLLVTIEERLVEKARSYKAEASIQSINLNGEWKPVKGRMLLYFKKDSLLPHLSYGSQIIFSKPLQKIKNSGNPGAFNYERYCAFQDIYHQAFLTEGEYVIALGYKGDWVHASLFKMRFWVIDVLRQYIKGEQEKGVAEALLIGYRDDLDKDLVQAYSNTGVVHIIAISGLHLGMIYAMLAWVFRRLKKFKYVHWLKPVVILLVLWIFTLLAGAVPSILRSAVMFSFIVLAETIQRKSTIYNTLASSAFVMLMFNPFFLWDVGFQLSYAAVLSILIFMRPIHNLVYIKNKSLDWVWKLCTVTLSAQILTIPIVIFYFHQFPNLFLITNFVIVPFSGIILYAELILIAVSAVTGLANFVGAITSGMLRGMNSFIQGINNLPFAVTDNLYIDALQSIVLYVVICTLCYWLLVKNKAALMLAITSIIIFVGLVSFEFANRNEQKKIIVYNVPKHLAIDCINGRSYSFIGDNEVLQDNFLENFHLKPSRVLHFVKPASNVEGLTVNYPFFSFNGKKVLVVDKPFTFQTNHKIPLDLIIISKSPKLYINDLLNSFTCNQFVFDGSNSLWKINQWKKDCDSLHLRHYSTQEQGAFELKL